MNPLIKPDYIKLRKIQDEVETELIRAMQLHKPFPTTHHGYGIIKEELDEAWDEIKANDRVRAKYEMIQVASSAIRYLHDLYEDGEWRK